MQDIQYMQDHSNTEEYLAVIDSSRRDKSIFPRPSNYSITFRDPFTHVYGCDVVELNVPRSGYLINASNNILRFRYTDPEWIARYGTAYLTVTVAQGNHDAVSLLAELNKQLKTYGRIIEVQNFTTPFEVRNQYIFLSEFPFEFDASSSIKNILGFAEVLVLPSKALTEYNVRYLTDLVPIVSSFTGSTNTDDGFPITKHRYLQQYFTAVKGGYLAGLEVFVIPFGDMTNVGIDIDYKIVHARTNRVIVTGQLTIEDNADYTKLRLDQVNQDPEDPFDVTDVYYVELYDADNSDINNCWRVTHGPMPKNFGTLFMTREDVRELFYENDHMINMRVYIHPIKHALIPPGIVNLSGAGFIQLRCPEIEKNLFKGRMYEETNVGLAFIKISKFIDFSERYTSSVTPRRTFHPISRLQKLTFTFTNPDGTEHDFRGVDHTIVLQLRYYTAPPAIYSMKALNPRYDPNPISYARQGLLRDTDE